MIAIIDAGIVMNTSTVPQIEGDIAIPRSVRQEIKSNQASHILDMMTNTITVIDPLPEYVDSVRQTAQSMGQNRLSDQDIDVLAVAMMMAQQDDIVIFSDDYGVRNVAHELGYTSKGVTTSGGAEKRYYRYKCRACGRVYDEIVPDCDICGHDKFKRLRA